MNHNVRKLFTQCVDDTLQIEPHSERRVCRAIQQRRQHNQVLLGTGDRTHQILVLLVVSVEEYQLLLPVSRIVENVDVQSNLNGRLVERVDEALNEPLFQPQQVSGGNGIFKPRQRGLTCQIGIVRQTVRDHFEDGVTE